MQIIDTSTLDQNATGLSGSEVYWVYNGLDCCVTMEIFEELSKQIDDVDRATYSHAMRMCAPILEMMLEGLPLDLARRQEMINYYQDEYDHLETIWNRILSEGMGISKKFDKVKKKFYYINPGSPKQLQTLFHDILGYKETKKRAKGKTEYSVTLGREVLENLSHHYFAEPLVNLILSMRDAQKALGFLKTKFDSDNRLRCSFNIAGTDTGRLSSSFSDMGTGTNLQNISGKLKEIIIAPPGQILVDIDLEQGDSRGVAAGAWEFFVEEHGEKYAGAYLDACESGDLHTTVCKMAWADLDWGQDEKLWRAVAEQLAYRDLSYRDLSKKLGHGTNYLGQPETMAGHTKVATPIIADFQVNYFNSFPCIKDWQNETIHQLQTNRYLTNLFGRRRYFWKDVFSQPVINSAIAYSPQGCTGEFINRGILQLWLKIQQENLPIKLLLQVHDSLVLCLPENRVNELLHVILKHLKVVKILKKGREFTIPLGVKAGWNYAKADPKNGKNPFGLLAWDGNENRTPPKRLDSLESILSAPV